MLENASSLTTETIAVTGWLITLVIAVAGWLYQSFKQRQLQRKQLAVALLSENRFQAAWIDGLKAVFYKINHDSSYDWEHLADKYFGSGQLNEEQQTLLEHLKTVLNYLEFIAVAVLNEAADEYIVKKAYAGHYLVLNRKVIKFINMGRSKRSDDNLWINFCTLADKWSPPAIPAGPEKWYRRAAQWFRLNDRKTD